MCSSKGMSRFVNSKIHSKKSSLSSPTTTSITTYNASKTQGLPQLQVDEAKHTPLQVLTLPATPRGTKTLVQAPLHLLPLKCHPPNQHLENFGFHHISYKEFPLVVSPNKAKLINNCIFHTPRPTSIHGLDVRILTSLT